MCAKTPEKIPEIHRVMHIYRTHIYIDNHVQYTSTHEKCSIVHISAYIMQHLHCNVINANMEEYVYKNSRFILNISTAQLKAIVSPSLNFS